MSKVTTGPVMVSISGSWTSLSFHLVMETVGLIVKIMCLVQLTVKVLLMMTAVLQVTTAAHLIRNTHPTCIANIRLDTVESCT